MKLKSKLVQLQVTSMPNLHRLL